MKLAYKLFGLTLLSGASAITYLLIPSSSVDSIENNKKLLPTKNNASWKQSLISQGYTPVDLNTPFEYYSGLLENFKRVKKLEDGTESSELRKLCNSFRAQDKLSSNEEADAKRWCVNPKKVEDILRDRGRKHIYTIENGAEVWNSEKIRNLARQYMQNIDENLKMATSWDNPALLDIKEQDLDGKLESFKSACSNALDAKSFEDDLEQKIKRAEKWCTEE